MENPVLETLIRLTELPEPLIRNELEVLLKQANLDPDSANIDDLRIVLANYVQEVLLEAKTRYSKK